jgi:hypothetical protein
MADLGLCEFDVVDRLRRDPGDERLDLIRAEAEATRRPFVKALRQLAHRGVAAFGDISDDRLDHAADLSVGLFLLAGERCRLDVPGYRFL